MPFIVGEFKLDNIRLGENRYSSGHKLPLTKLDPRLLSLFVNSGKGVSLLDANYANQCCNIEQGKTLDLLIKANAVTDKSGNGNHPTLTDVTLENGVMKFNGSTSKCLIPHSTDYKTPSFTIHIKFKVNEFLAGEYPRLFDCEASNEGLRYYSADNGNTVLNLFNGTGIISNTSPDSLTLVAGRTYDLVMVVEDYAGDGFCNVKHYLDGALNVSREPDNVLSWGIGNMTVGNKENGTRTLSGEIYAFEMWDYALSADEVAVVSNKNQVLYPSQVDCNIARDTALKTLAVEFYLNNNVEEPSDVIEIYDDDETFWTSGDGSMVLSEETTIVNKGISALKVVCTTTPQWTNFFHTYGTNQDFSGKEFLVFRFYGNNDGNSYCIAFYAPNDSNQLYYWFTNNFTGWKTFVVPVLAMESVGSPDMSTVHDVKIFSSAVDLTSTYYLDRIVLCDGNWAKIEIGIPDELTNNLDVKVYSWSGATFVMDVKFTSGGNLGSDSTEGFLAKFLDGTDKADVYPSTNGTYATYKKGKRGEVQGGSWYGNSIPITYGKTVPTKNRVGFAIKLPPDDGQDASDDGISQCLHKIVVSYI